MNEQKFIDRYKKTKEEHGKDTADRELIIYLKKELKTRSFNYGVRNQKEFLKMLEQVNSHYNNIAKVLKLTKDKFKTKQLEYLNKVRKERLKKEQEKNG